MRRVALVLGTAAVLLWAAGAAYAQEKPNFSGTWTMDAAKTEADGMMMGGGRGGRGGRGGGGAAGMTIKQDAMNLTIERQMGRGGMQATTYKLDGSETTVTGGRGGDGTATAAWDGAKLVIKETRPGRGGGGMQTVTTTYSMDGAWLVVESSRPGRQGGDPITTKIFYSKG
jgi:hypothetical protein